MSTKVERKKETLFVIENIEDAKQEEKHDPDLLEAIVTPTDPVKEELWMFLFRMRQFGSKIQEIMVSTFWIP